MISTVTGAAFHLDNDLTLPLQLSISRMIPTVASAAFHLENDPYRRLCSVPS